MLYNRGVGRIIGSCTASTALGYECYNTLSTCQDQANYDETDKEYKFCLKGSRPPVKGEVIRPYLEKYPADMASKIDITRAVTSSAKRTYVFLDEPDTDVGLDHYYANRPYIPKQTGTFWPKWLARNFYYEGWVLTEKRGYAGLAESDYPTLKSFIERIEGPDEKGRVCIVGKDILKRAQKVKIPRAPTAKVVDNPLTSGATTINFAFSGSIPLATGDTVRIDDEIILLGTVTDNEDNTGDATGCTRAQWNTVADEHSVDAKMQECFTYSDTDAWDIIDNALENSKYLDIAASDIDVTGAESERDIWMPAFSFTGIISEPMDGDEVIAGLLEQSLSLLWWDPEEAKIKFKAYGFPLPNAAVAELTDTNVVDGTPEVDYNDESRITNVVVFYNRRDGINDVEESSSYANAYVAVPGTDNYNTEITKVIYGYWITSEATARLIANRLMRRFGNPPKVLSFPLTFRDGDDIGMADILKMTTRRVQDASGAQVKEQRYQVVEKRRGMSRIRLKVIDTGWSERFATIAPAGTSDYDSASETGKQDYIFIADGTTGLMPNGDPPYCVF